MNTFNTSIEESRNSIDEDGVVTAVALSVEGFFRRNPERRRDGLSVQGASKPETLDAQSPKETKRAFVQKNRVSGRKAE